MVLVYRIAGQPRYKLLSHLGGRHQATAIPVMDLAGYELPTCSDDVHSGSFGLRAPRKLIN